MNDAQKIWIKSFDGNSWDLEIINDNEDFPDDLLFEILGSRKSIIFVEGENGSHDVSLYREIFPNFLIIPRGSCTQVIFSVKAFKSHTQFHHLRAFGIIDRDRRQDKEITELKKSDVFTLEVAEVENLFCTIEIVKIVSRHLGRNPEEDFSNIKSKILNRLRSELEVQVSLLAVSEIKFLLNCFDESARGATKLNSALENLGASIDVLKIYDDFHKKFSEILSSNDYNGLLKLYNRKSLPTQISGDLGLANGELPKTVIRLLNTELRGEIVSGLKKYFGDFARYIN